MRTKLFLSCRSNPRRPYWIRLFFLFLFSLPPAFALSGEHPIIQLKDFDQTEVKAGGFSLASDARMHIRALGAGDEKREKDADASLFAYGWIIDAATRELVWKMDFENTSREKDDRRFDDEISLK